MPVPVDFSTQSWWPRCISLDRIIHCVGSKETREGLNALQQELSLHTLVERTQTHDDPRAGLKEEANRFFELSSQHRALVEGQKGIVLSAIRKGQLRAFGYQHPRRIEDKPVEVPLDLWGGFVRWDKSELERDGLKVVSVRLIGAQKILPAPSPSVPVPAPGRPTRAPQIIEAYTDLVRTGQLAPTDNMKTKAASIRAHVNSHYPSPDSRTDGLDYETIRRTLNAHTQNTKS